MHVQEMIRTHPDAKGNLSEALIRCVEDCYACAQSCTACADSCLAEKSVEQLRQCIRLDLDCADICAMTGALGSRRTGSDAAVLRRAIELCAEACRVCGEECARHAGHHEHCRICADVCRQCESSCRDAIRDVH